jgi:hypothetical protein
MRKNQKACLANDGYSKEEIYLAIELWQESGLSRGNFYSHENLSVKKISYWYRKYKKEKGLSPGRNNEVPDTFIPIKVSVDKTTTVRNEGYGSI